MQEKLCKIIEYSIKNVNYYKKLNLHDNIRVEDLPLLSKHDLQHNAMALISDLEINNMNFLLRKHSSGSSGIPTTVYWSQNMYMQSMMHLWKRRIKFYNISPYSIELDFTNSSLNRDKWILPKKKGISVSRSIIDDDEKLEKLFYYIDNLNVEWIYIQPHVAAKLIAFIKRSNVKIPSSIKYIEFVGEILSESIRRETIDLFRVPVANMYGSEEMNGIAYECPYGHMHVLQDNVYVETEYPGEGEIFVSSLTNYTMPLLRYQQGDIIYLSNNVDCKCGCSGQIINSVCGRSYETIKTNKITINPYILIAIMEHINQRIGGYIKQYQFIWDQREQLLSLRLYCVSSMVALQDCVVNLVQKNLEAFSLHINRCNFAFFDGFPLELEKYSILKIVNREE